MSTQQDGNAQAKEGVLAGFKQFLMRGNVMDLAVAVVIGAAFTNIVNSVVKGVINPIVGLFGSKNLDKYYSCFSDACVASPEGEVTKGVAILWGPVLSATLTFVMTAAVVYFLMIVPMNKIRERQAAKAPAEEEGPAGPTEVELLAEIRDALVTAGGADRGTGTVPMQK